ncbi:MAG: T9SS type A sorting domain-containing protein [Bacteroidota bacterium]
MKKLLWIVFLIVISSISVFSQEPLHPVCRIGTGHIYFSEGKIGDTLITETFVDWNGECCGLERLTFENPDSAFSIRTIDSADNWMARPPNGFVKYEILYHPQDNKYHQASISFKLYCGAYSTLDINGAMFVGIAEENVNDEILLLPNPASDFLKIHLPENQEFLKAELFSVSGFKISEIQNDLFKSSVANFPVANFPVGAYYLKIFLKDSYIIKPVIIIR